MPRENGDKRPGAWARRAVDRLLADRAAERPTPLHAFPLAGPGGTALYLKDESRRPTGSLKHGPARDLFIDALRRGRIDRDTPLYEATSGNMAVAQAHFARLLDLEYTAVVPERTGPAKRRRIESRGGRVHPVDPPLAVYERAGELARTHGGHYLDHLQQVGRAIDFASPSSLGAEILGDLERLGEPDPAWIVLGAGTGATSAAVGRALRRRGSGTRLAVVDPENSAYFPGWASGVRDYTTGMPSRIEGIGRPRMEPAFDPDLVDLVIPVPDAASVAAMRHLHAVTGVLAGPSSGSCLWGACQVLDRMRRDGAGGPVVLIVGDGGEAYHDTYYDDSWSTGRGLDLAGPLRVLRRFTETGDWTPGGPS
ncbi:putative siderophore biosynthesis protein SbnA [Streptomyces sp. YIM 130001]|uniref:PLP-dependent cysteine synthase family protein n=1 Tax=Streptomyces sp. YIM 130001 TaxID=2259644 RepID=UPI000E64EEB5|nr:pyridoxal-phosphate dependent enzyme [Streptomyces sp. YIM 130001]RII17845.1 putative siderophore biosynthesis protein SbnA [Streptomyces sp. YIM 130001]